MVSPVVEKVAAGNSCRECGRYRFEASQPSYMYLLTHPSLRLHKVGIGTTSKDKGRLEQLINSGWVAFGIWHGDQRTTFLWEKIFFAEVKKIILAQETSKGEPFGKWVDNWSESISAEELSVTEIAKIIEKIIEKNGKR